MTANPTNGQFRVFLAEGRYTVRCDGQESIKTFLPAGAYQLDLRPGRALDFELSNLPGKDGTLRISLSARGEGVHNFSIRGNNLDLADNRAELNLRRGSAGALEWSARIVSAETPWVAVVMADDNPTTRRELVGAIWDGR